MDELQTNTRVTDDSPSDQTEQSREGDNSVVFVARRLANPRRVRL